jgi:hypothetical protein
MFVQIKDVVVLCEADRQQLCIPKAEQAVRSNNDYTTLFNKSTEVIKTWEMSVPQMSVPHAIGITLNIMFIAVVHASVQSPFVWNAIIL